ncbi:MAG: M28 family peptidase, partial [Bacillota bacterium]
MKKATMAFLLVAASASAHVAPMESFTHKPILADLSDLRALNIPILAKEESVGVGYAVVTPELQQKLQIRAHQVGKCGGFEDLSQDASLYGKSFSTMLNDLAAIKAKDDRYQSAPFRLAQVEKNPAIEAAMNEVSEDNIKATVQWLSSYPTRYNRSSTPNVHVDEMKKRLEALLVNSKIPYEVSLISHASTPQKSVRVRLIGSTRPNEIVVLGGHFDSINQGWGASKEAPGADDNASGSANIFEVLRIISQKEQPQRSIEFFWYAGEESGLLGSAEIAKQYKNDKKDVVAVLQLDMTLYPGSGEFVVGNMTDFTSGWLRDY